MVLWNSLKVCLKSWIFILKLINLVMGIICRLLCGVVGSEFCYLPNCVIFWKRIVQKLLLVQIDLFFCIARDFLLFQMPDFHPHINSACKKRDFWCEICCYRAFACSFIFLGWFVWLLKFYSAFCRQGFYILWWYVYGWGLCLRGLCYWRHSCPVVIFGWFYFETSTE